ncbi:Sb-PDE family phosphodiesterase [Fulvivirgaceae bacterium BMA12]|uniref:Sb-PDE family phosphodiesterase n=1 Tax=Agaribacillus aureus TaxID=3051825 RepID=A0ABT8KZY8_9BACT|nr:Sb-PDE family phosphodiesterase [Fulvivirgaceae bacterium BMA12]
MKIDTLLLFLVLNTSGLIAQNNNLNRSEPNLPDIPGYKTILADFHLHTVFSDGKVWPTVRVDEAWEHGYKAIAITDHIEDHQYRKYIAFEGNLNASNKIAQREGERQDIIVIAGTEITRAMPPGHLNAIFVKDVDKIATHRVKSFFNKNPEATLVSIIDSIDHHHKDYMESLLEARNQSAFIFWNHPMLFTPEGEKLELPDVHKDLIKKGLIQGIEVADLGHYHPEAFQWCLDYNLTLLGNTDLHDPYHIDDATNPLERRNATLVFTADITEQGIKEALENQRTAVWVNDMVIGKQSFLEPLVRASIAFDKPHFIDENRTRYIKITNNSDFKFHIDSDMIEEKTFLDFLTLNPNSSQILKIPENEAALKMTILNFQVAPEKPLTLFIKL